MNYSFLENGVERFSLHHLKDELTELKAFFLDHIDFGDVFVSKNEFQTARRPRGINPRPGRNLAEKAETDFLFSDKNFTDKMTGVLGQKWRVIEYKAVVAMPDQYIDSWILDELERMQIPNLGMFLKETARNVTMFRGIALHQDIIDFPLRHPDFVTTYIYLDDVSESSAPLTLVPDSHLNGIQRFPHRIEGDQHKGPISYTNMFRADYELTTFLGRVGDAAFWHPYLLHGTAPVRTVEPRISLRLLIEKNADLDKGCQLDMVNEQIGPLEVLATTRSDEPQSTMV